MTALDNTATANLSALTATSVTAAGSLTEGETVSFTGNLGKAVVTLSSTGNGTDEIFNIDGATLGTATFSVGANATLQGTAAKLDGVTASGAGTVAVTALEGDLAADLSGITATTISAVIDTNGGVTYSGDLGTAAVTLTSSAADAADILTVSAANASGNTFTANSVNETVTITGSAGAQTLSGTANDDTITGGAGADTMAGGTGADTFIFAAGAADTVAAADSVAGIDKITDLVVNGAGADLIDLTVTVAAVNTAVTTGSANAATFITDVNTLLNVNGGVGFDTAAAGDISAVLLTLNAGDQSGKTFLAVDIDSSDTFTAADFIIDVTGITATSLTTVTFI